jgi:hypothetical protein
MTRRGDPLLDRLPELIGRHAGMRRCQELDDALLARGRKARHVAGERRLKGLTLFPLGMLRSLRLHTIDGEGELKVDLLLGPQRAIVVEGGDALGNGHEVAASGRTDAGDEVEDSLLGRCLIPGG